MIWEYSLNVSDKRVCWYYQAFDKFVFDNTNFLMVYLVKIMQGPRGCAKFLKLQVLNILQAIMENKTCS